MTSLFVSSVSYQIYSCEINQYIVKVADRNVMKDNCYGLISLKKYTTSMRKPVFGVSDQIRHEPSCTATEDC